LSAFTVSNVSGRTPSTVSLSFHRRRRGCGNRFHLVREERLRGLLVEDRVVGVDHRRGGAEVALERMDAASGPTALRASS
jgi:hypothetical protein